jgi:flagellar protein FlaI
MAAISERIAALRDAFRDDAADGCDCRPTFADGVLDVDASACVGDGHLATSPDCRATVVDALTRRDATNIRSEAQGVERSYTESAVELLVAAGRFVEATRFHDERLAARARRDPLAAGREATGRADVVADIAAETGLAEHASDQQSYDTAISAYAGSTVSRWQVEPSPPTDGALRAVTELATGGTVRRYDVPTGPDHYHLDPLSAQLDRDATSVLAAAYERLAAGEFEGGDRAPGRAVRAVCRDRDDDSLPVERIARVLRKHARGHGLLADLFANPALSDAFVTAPAPANCLRVTIDGETLITNVRLTERGVAAMSSRFRRESGRAFSRADPTLDATATVADRRLRVAGVTEPTSDGTAFAFRAQDRDVWTLPALLRNDTLSPAAAGLLSVVIERGGSILTAGPRGAGKTTLLGALLWELPPSVRTVVIEDTPELPVDPLQRAGRDVQVLVASDEREELTPVEALRTALRLGDGALVVGEVRGSEASVLYEAMRVGANSEAVMGTIHGDGADAVYERVVTDLGVSPSSFGVTDLVVTCEITGESERRIKSIEEVVGSDSPTFETLFKRTNTGLEPTGHVARGNSKLLAGLTEPGETYADLRSTLDARERLLDALATRNETDGKSVTASHDDR